jgi:hypothetical protein
MPFKERNGTDAVPTLRGHGKKQRDPAPTIC